MKFIKIHKLYCILLALAFLLTACKSSEVSSATVLYSDETSVVIKAEETGGSLEDAMNYLKDRGELDFSGVQGDYGLFVETVDGYTADTSKKEFWAVYTTLDELDGVSYSDESLGTYNYEDIICCGALFGVSGLPMEEGEIYVISLDTYQ